MKLKFNKTELEYILKVVENDMEKLEGEKNLKMIQDIYSKLVILNK